MKTLVAVLFVAAVAVPPALAEPTPLKWPSHTMLAGQLSNYALYASIGLDTIHSVQADDRGAAFRCQAIRLGTAVGISSLTKALVRRARPDGSNDGSFFSGHTANAMAASGWRVSVGVPIAVGVGYLRLAAGKHYMSDVVTGAAVGFLASRLCHE